MFVQVPSEARGTGSIRAEVTVGCEPLLVGAQNQI